MKPSHMVIPFFLLSNLIGCGTPEQERLQLAGEWRVDLSDLLVIPLSDSPVQLTEDGRITDEDLAHISAGAELGTSILKLQRDGVATLIAGGLGKSAYDVPKEYVKSGTWEIAGSGANLKLKLNFSETVVPTEVLSDADIPFDRQKTTSTLIAASLPHGEGKWTPIEFDSPNKFGTVKVFTQLLPSSKREYNRWP